MVQACGQHIQKEGQGQTEVTAEDPVPTYYALSLQEWAVLLTTKVDYQYVINVSCTEKDEVHIHQCFVSKIYNIKPQFKSKQVKIIFVLLFYCIYEITAPLFIVEC